MPDRPLTVHCSGLGGGLLSPDHDYDIFFQNHAQMKVYGPSLAMTDDWEQRITQLGLTKTTHEYAIYQLFSTALGWSAWKVFLPDRFANLKLLITRAIRLLTAATIRPAHARPPHPTWVTAVRQIFRCYHPQGKLLLLRACFPHYVTASIPDGIRDIDVLGFSAGSYTGLAIHKVLNEFDCFPGTTKVAAIASPPDFFLWPAPLSFDWSPHLRLTCGPAGNRTTTGSLSASSRTTPYQLLHRDALPLRPKC